MKLIKKICATFMVFTTLLASTTINSHAALPVEKLAVSKTASHVVLIVGHKSNKNKVTVNDYTKSADGTWKKNWYVNGIAGTNGISLQKAEEKAKTLGMDIKSSGEDFLDEAKAKIDAAYLKLKEKYAKAPETEK